jgi:hypothetical protein
MDGTAAINFNLEALKRILAGLVSMAGLAGALTSPLCGLRGRSSDRASGSIVGQEGRGDCAAIGDPGKIREASGEGCDAEKIPTRRSDDRRPPHKGEVKPSFTLPRHLRLAILRLLRPAESAARRLIVAAARGLVVALPPPRKSGPKPATMEPQLRRFGIAVVMSSADLARADAARRTAALRAARPRSLTLPLFDPPRRALSQQKGRTVPAHTAPRILLPGVAEPFVLPPPPSPDDPIDATRLGLRFAALAAALDDLPGQAKRFVRWRAHQANARQAPAPGRRISPLRSGRPPGGRLARFDPSAYRNAAGAQRRRAPRNIREVDEILAHAHALALYALQHPDTS